MTVTIEWLGVLVAFVLVFALNFVWFSEKGFFLLWYKAMERDYEKLRNAPPQDMGKTFGLTALAIVVQAVTLSWVLQAIAALYESEVTLGLGISTGAVVGIAFAAFTSLGHRLFSGFGFGPGVKMWLIETGADVLGLTVMGAVLSFWY